MSNVYISPLADNKIKEYLSNAGYNVVEIEGSTAIDEAIAYHPDIYMCNLGKPLPGNASCIFHGDAQKLTKDYPGHAIYNGCSTGKYFLHNLKITDSQLLSAVDQLDLIKVHVPQGYAKCNILVVDESSIITSDLGIAKAATNTDLNVLVIDKGQVVLDGYPYGFLGGASGKVGNVILFNGDLSKHSNFLEVKRFIEDRGFEIKYFEGYPLTDIGSIIVEDF